jgi:hypothetical protein
VSTRFSATAVNLVTAPVDSRGSLHETYNPGRDRCWRGPQSGRRSGARVLSDQRPVPRKRGLVLRGPREDHGSCNVAVSWVITGHERVLINGQPITADTPPAGPGDRIYSVSPDEHAVFKNEATGQTYRVKDDGSFLDVVKKNGRDLRSKGKGRNFYQGLGVTGILFTTKRHSVQKFTVTDYMDPVKSTLHFHKITGKQIDICHKVGAESVPGKNLPQPEAASPAKAMARVHD